MIEIARMLNPDVHTLVRAGDASEVDLLHRDGVGDVFLAKKELAASMTSRVMTSLEAAR